MKVALVCSHGGHLTEMMAIAGAFDDHDSVYVTYDSSRTEGLEFDPYTLENIGTSPIRMALAFVAMARIFWSERPDVIVSTGSEIAIPAFVVGKLFGTRTVFVESWCRVRTPSKTGRIVYPLADLFLVQWPPLLQEYGSKAKYEGAIL